MNHSSTSALLHCFSGPIFQPSPHLQAFFSEVLHQLQDGLDVSGGFVTHAGRVTADKAKAMTWCLSEASLQVKRETIAAATCVSISRDERHGRLHCRYRCVSSDFSFSCGYLGQSRDHTPDSISISRATKRIFEEFCLKDAGPPSGSALQPCADTQLYKHMCAITEAISVDSASNELASARELCSWHPDLGLQFLTHCKFILRDAAHSARRILGRGFGADPILENTMGLFVHWKHSPGQMIHHSIDMQRLYAECCAAASSESAVSTAFVNMRSAKHRIETFTTPLSRCILNMTGLLSFLMKVAVQRKGRVEGKAAESFLDAVCADLLVQAAMMCDASSETLQLIRVLDTEDIPVADLCASLQTFLTRLGWLFNDGGCLQVEGHTRHIVQWLATPHFLVVNGRGKCLGGGRLNDSIIEASMDRMRAWVKLARSIVDAEFPAFGIISALSAFSLAGAPVAVGPETRTKLERLAQSFGKRDLVRQYTDHLAWAVRAFRDAGQQGSHWSAWAAAIRATRGLALHPSDHLAFVVQRGICFAPTTSPIEQSFSVVAEKLGTRRLNAQPLQESRTIGLLLLKLTAAEEHDLVARARANWTRCFAGRASRTHSSEAERADKGVKRKSVELVASPAPPGTKPTEAQFLRNYHASLALAAAGTPSASPPMPPCGAWGGSHCKEENFQRSKLSSRFVEANLQGLVLAQEQTAVVNQATLAEQQRMARSFKERESHASRVSTQLGSQLPTGADLQRAAVFVESGTSLPSNWQHVLARYEARAVTSLLDAKIFVVQNPWSVTDTLVAWASALGGAWLVTPGVLEHGRGAALKRPSALSTPRRIWVDHPFREQHPRLWLLILEMVNSRKAKWRFLASADAWAEAKAKAMQQARSAEVLALVGGSDNVREQDHIFDASMFLNFITRSDGVGSLGMVGM